MNSIAQINQSEKQLSEKMQYFLRRYHVSRILRSANAYKLRGFPVLSIFLVAFSTVFTQRSKYLLSVEAAVRKGNETLPVRLVFVRNRNNRKDWLVLVTTDMHLSEEEVIRIYGKRWGIEVFFKVCKSYLHLEKDCRAVSYDAMTAHVSIDG